MNQELTPPASAQAREARNRLFEAAKANKFVFDVLTLLPPDALALAALAVEQEAQTTDERVVAIWNGTSLSVCRSGSHLGGEVMMDKATVRELWEVRPDGGGRKGRTFREFADAFRFAAGLA